MQRKSQRTIIEKIKSIMKPSSPKPSDESIGEDRPLAFSITNILHHVSILHLLEIVNNSLFLVKIRHLHELKLTINFQTII